MKQASPLPIGPRAADFVSQDAIIHALYECISGYAGQARDWERYRALFASEARLVLSVVRAGERPYLRTLDVEGFIRRVEPIFAVQDFFEEEVSRKSDTIGQMAHVLSAYESRRAPGERAFESGVNSMQLFHDAERWWIVTVMWNTTRG